MIDSMIDSIYAVFLLQHLIHLIHLITFTTLRSFGSHPITSLDPTSLDPTGTWNLVEQNQPTPCDLNILHSKNRLFRSKKSRWMAKAMAFWGGKYGKIEGNTSLFWMINPPDFRRISLKTHLEFGDGTQSFLRVCAAEEMKRIFRPWLTWFHW